MEKHSIDKFTPETLFERLKDCLTFLRHSIKKRELQAYMLPERNLFSEKLIDSKTGNVLEREIDSFLEKC